MIHTKEPANVFYVYLSAYRAINLYAVNEKLTVGLIRKLRSMPGLYGNVINVNVEGCYHEAGVGMPTVERTIVVKCTRESQVAELTYLACKEYDQDAVLVVNSQTHTTHLASIKMVGEYPQAYPQYHEERIGTFTKQDTGSEMYSIINGERWEVA